MSTMTGEEMDEMMEQDVVDEPEETVEEDAKDGPKKSRNLTSTIDVNEIIQGKREKKTVQRLDFQVAKPKEKLKIEDGGGDKLGDIARANHQIGRMKAPDLKPLHKILFDRPGAMATMRRNMRLFNGFSFPVDSDLYIKKQKMLLKLTNSKLKIICKVLDLEKGGVQSVLVERILTFLLAPKNTGRPVKKTKPKKRVATKVSEGKTKTKAKAKSASRSPKKTKAKSPSSSPRKTKAESKSKAIVTDSSSDEDEEEDKPEVETEEKDVTATKKEEETSDEETDNSSEEESKPAAKGKATAKKPAPAKQRASKKTPQKKTKEDKSDSESDSENDDEDDKDSGSEVEKPKKKQTTKKAAPAKSAAKTKKADSSSNRRKNTSKKDQESGEDSSDDDEPLIKMIKKPPSDEQLTEKLKAMLKDADLEEMTMKQICQKVYDAYPEYDLTNRKDFIKQTVKMLIS